MNAFEKVLGKLASALGVLHVARENGRTLEPQEGQSAHALYLMCKSFVAAYERRK